VRLEDVAELQYIVVQHLPLVSAIPDDHHGDEGGQTPAGSVTPRSMPEEGRSSVDVGRPTYQLGPQPQSGFLRSSLLPFSRAASTSNMPSGAAGNHARPGQQRSTAATAATSTGNTRAPGSVTPSKHHSGPSSRSAGISGGQAAQDVTQEPNIGDPSVVNLLYLDNPSLEMYHQLLYGRPYSTLVGRHHRCSMDIGSTSEISPPLAWLPASWRTQLPIFIWSGACCKQSCDICHPASGSCALGG
jgi:hypothetical protein